jgi:hypothetical protein
MEHETVGMRGAGAGHQINCIFAISLSVSLPYLASGIS